MQAQEFVREGRLAEALTALQADIRRQPAEPTYRVFLFQLLCVLGEWERALAQLQLVGELDAAALPMVQTYRAALQCEMLRAQIFAGRRAPVVFGEPLPWMVLLIEALRLEAEGLGQEAASTRERAFALAPAVPGRADGKRFAWIADADGRIGPFLEAIVEGRYLWIPFERVRRVDIEAPVDMRDLVWTPANFTWTNGGATVGLMPTRYAGTTATGEAGLLLARRTEWSALPSGASAGLGQRMFATDDVDHALLNLRCIELDGVGGLDGKADGDG